MRSWWVPELPSDFPECPTGFMWVVIPCRGEHVDDGESSLHDADLEERKRKPLRREATAKRERRRSKSKAGRAHYNMHVWNMSKC